MKSVVVVRTGLAAAAAASLVYFIHIRGTPGMFQFDDAFMFVLSVAVVSFQWT